MWHSLKHILRVLLLRPLNWMLIVAYVITIGIVFYFFPASNHKLESNYPKPNAWIISNLSGVVQDDVEVNEWKWEDINPYADGIRVLHGPGSEFPIEQIRQLEHLEFLDLKHYSLTHQHVNKENVETHSPKTLCESISSLSQLKRIVLPSRMRDKPSLKPLAKLEQLEWLVLSDNETEEQLLTTLPTLPGLKRLTIISANSLQNEDVINALNRQPQLNELIITSPIRDLQFDLPEQMGKIDTVGLIRYGNRADSPDVVALQEALPAKTIHAAGVDIMRIGVVAVFIVALCIVTLFLNANLAGLMSLPMSILSINNERHHETFLLLGLSITAITHFLFLVHYEVSYLTAIAMIMLAISVSISLSLGRSTLKAFIAISVGVAPTFIMVFCSMGTNMITTEELLVGRYPLVSMVIIPLCCLLLLVRLMSENRIPSTLAEMGIHTPVLCFEDLQAMVTVSQQVNKKSRLTEWTFNGSLKQLKVLLKQGFHHYQKEHLSLLLSAGNQRSAFNFHWLTWAMILGGILTGLSSHIKTLASTLFPFLNYWSWDMTGTSSLLFFEAVVFLMCAMFAEFSCWMIRTQQLGHQWAFPVSRTQWGETIRTELWHKCTWYPVICWGCIVACIMPHVQLFECLVFAVIAGIYCFCMFLYFYSVAMLALLNRLSWKRLIPFVLVVALTLLLTMGVVIFMFLGWDAYKEAEHRIHFFTIGPWLIASALALGVAYWFDQLARQQWNQFEPAMLETSQSVGG